MIRQGDVLILFPTDPSYRTPTGRLTTVPSDQGRLVLAYGEATGHHHSVPATATLELDEGGVMYLTVDQLIELTHQEHAAITIPAVERAEVRRQREGWSEAYSRPVVD